MLSKYFWGYRYNGKKEHRSLYIRQGNTHLSNMGTSMKRLCSQGKSLGTVQQGCLLWVLSTGLQCCTQDSPTFSIWPLETCKKRLKSFLLSHWSNSELPKTSESKAGSLNFSVCGSEVLNWRFSAWKNFWSEFLALLKSVNVLSLALVGSEGRPGYLSC